MFSQQNERILNQLYKSDLTRYENLELLFQTARNISTIDGELDEAISICQKVKVKAASLTKLDIRFFDLYYKCLLFRAPHYFDDFLLYIEKDRDANFVDMKCFKKKVCSLVGLPLLKLITT
jgi:hypothetical protein